VIPLVSQVRFRRAPQARRHLGLEGWITFVLAGHVLISGVALRRSRRGEYVFTWPATKLYSAVPVDEDARHAIECALLTALFVEIREDAA
jgi:hypothetical protein